MDWRSGAQRVRVEAAATPASRAGPRAPSDFPARSCWKAPCAAIARPATRRFAASAVLMKFDAQAGAIARRGQERACDASAAHDGLPPLGTMREREVPVRVANVDVAQFLLGYLQPLAGGSVVVAAVSQSQRVMQKRYRCLRGLPQVVLPGFRDQHFSLERHFIDVAVSCFREQAANVGSSVLLVANGASRFHQRFAVHALKKVIASNKFDLPTPLAPAIHVKGPKRTLTSARFLNPFTFKRINMVWQLRRN